MIRENKGVNMMKLTVSKNVFNQSIQHVSKAISNRTSVQVLSGIKIDVQQTGLTLTASDTEISIQSFIPVEPDNEQSPLIEQEGSVVLPAKFLVEMIRKLPSHELEIEVTQDFNTWIRAGASELQIAGLDPDEYPIMPDLPESQLFSMKSSDLKMMIRQTVFAISTSESTPILTGILWTLENGKLKFVATDRHRLASRQIQLQTNDEAEFKNIVISGKSLNELTKIMSEQDEWIDMIVSDHQVLIKMGNLHFYTGILNGTYPDTTKVIPQSFKTELTVSTKLFMDAIDRAHLLSREDRTNIVYLTTLDEGKIEISSSLSTLGKITEQCDVVEMNGEPLKISFNSKYMLDALKSIDPDEDVIHVGFNGMVSPIIIKPITQKDTLHLILPYRTS